MQLLDNTHNDFFILKKQKNIAAALVRITFNLATSVRLNFIQEPFFLQ